jgi:hypothetical protein
MASLALALPEVEPEASSVVDSVRAGRSEVPLYEGRVMFAIV